MSAGRMRPPGERLLLHRAWELVCAAFGEERAWEGDLAAFLPADEAEAAAAVAALPEIDVLQRAHAIVSREWCAGADPRSRTHCCGWCVSAVIRQGVDEVVAWGQAKRFDDLAAIQAHTLECPHNPLVQKLRELDAQGRH